MGLFRNADEPITAATVRSFDRIPTHARTSLIDTDLWHLYRCVPEIHYAVNQQARLVGRLDWRISIEGKEVDDSEEVMRQAFGGDLRGIATYGALHLQVAGQFYLIRTPTSQRGKPRWRIIRSPLPHDQKKVAEAANAVVQVVIEDPALDERADSPVMAVKDIASELILTRAQARATARNRTAQLMTVIYPKEGAGPDPAAFERKIAKVMTDPLSDEKSGSVAVPNLIAWPQQYIDGWKTLDFTGPIDERLHERVDRLIRQLAVGLDITPSLLLGLEDSTHWTAWASQEDNWLGHVEPLAAPIGQAMAAAIAMLTGADVDDIEITPDPAPLLKRRPAIADVLAAWEAGLISDEWAREQLGAPESEAGPGRQQIEAGPQQEREVVQEPVIEASEQRQITATPTAAAVGSEGVDIDGRRLAEIDEQAYASFQDLVQDIADRVLEKLGARVRSLLQGRPGEAPPRDMSNIEVARTYAGEIPNATQTLEQTVQEALVRVLRIITRAQGRIRAMGIDIETSTEEDPRVIGAGEAFLAAVVATVAAIRGGGTGTAEASMAARQIATIAGGGEASDFGGAVSGIALAAATMAVIRRDHDLVPIRSNEGNTLYRWLHLYEGLHPHPVHLSLKDALVDQVPVFAGYLAFPGDHAGCECVVAPADLVRVRTGWSELQPTAGRDRA